jgi:hypothetical protein
MSDSAEVVGIADNSLRYSTTERTKMHKANYAVVNFDGTQEVGEQYSVTFGNMRDEWDGPIAATKEEAIKACKSLTKTQKLNLNALAIGEYV